MTSQGRPALGPSEGGLEILALLREAKGSMARAGIEAFARQWREAVRSSLTAERCTDQVLRIVEAALNSKAA